MAWFPGNAPEGFNRIVAPSGEECYIHQTVRATGKVEVGRFSYICEGAQMIGFSPIRIGAFVSIGASFRCATHVDHPTHYASSFPLATIVGVEYAHCDRKGVDANNLVNDDKSVLIQADVWIGDDVIVRGGVTIGHGCVIGTRSLVMSDCEPFGIYVGSPAKLKKFRFRESIIADLLQIAWWDWPLDRIRRNTRLFDTDFTTYEGSVLDLVVP